MRFKVPFEGVPLGHIYPVRFEPGDECPPELAAAAGAMGALEEAPQAKGRAQGGRG